MGATLIGCVRFVAVRTDGHCLDLDSPVGAWDWMVRDGFTPCFEWRTRIAMVVGSALIGRPQMLLLGCLEASPWWTGGCLILIVAVHMVAIGWVFGSEVGCV
ncbi:hypothetical protein ACLOJK_026857 [Asimina triloba]